MEKVGHQLRSQIQGHQIPILKLSEALQKNHLPHAMLFVGPESIGKKKVAFVLAQKLLCKNKDVMDDQHQGLMACGVCPSCLRVAKHQSENVMLIEPEGLNIKIDQTRAVIHFLSLANFNNNRVVIIDQAHMMNLQAANALLKILEEPNENVFFILIAPESDTVLSTIRSRSHVIRFQPLSLSEMKLIKPGLPDWVYQCSRGQLNVMTNLSSDEGLNRRIQSFDLLDSFWTEPEFLNAIGAEVNWRTFFKDRAEAQDIIKNWILIMRDVLVLKMNESGSLLNTDQIERLKKISFLDKSKINFFISQLLKLEKEIQNYMDGTLLIESLWVKHARK